MKTAPGDEARGLARLLENVPPERLFDVMEDLLGWVLKLHHTSAKDFTND
jgi:hypothetical protein